jgi:asparagine synthase (glutamine-hydrolysing)
MRSVIGATGCNVHEVAADTVSPFVDIDRQQWHTDHPVGAPMYMDWQIFKSAQKAGVRTVLSGFDGDSTVSHGYEDLANLALRRRYWRLLRESFALKRNMPRKSHTFKRLFWKNGVKKALPSWSYSAWRMLKGLPSERQDVRPLHFRSIDPKFLAKHDLEKRVADLNSASFPKGMSPIEAHWRALTNGHFADTLENLEKASAAFGVEAGFPFFDRRLVELCISLPPGQRIYRGWTRSIFRHAMKGVVPADVLWRTDKSNIGASVKINMLKLAPDRLSGLFETSNAVLQDYICEAELRPAYDDYRESPMKRDQEALLLLRNVYLMNWLENLRSDLPTIDRSVTTGTAVGAL